MRRGEVWLINLDPAIGAEIQKNFATQNFNSQYSLYCDKKTRPAVIVNDNAVGILPLKVIVPVTDWKDHYSVAPWMVRLEPSSGNGLDKISAADTFQVRSVAQTRFIRRLGKLSGYSMQEITDALSVVLGIE